MSVNWRLSPWHSLREVAAMCLVRECLLAPSWTSRFWAGPGGPDPVSAQWSLPGRDAGFLGPWWLHAGFLLHVPLRGAAAAPFGLWRSCRWHYRLVSSPSQPLTPWGDREMLGPFPWPLILRELVIIDDDGVEWSILSFLTGEGDTWASVLTSEIWNQGEDTNPLYSESTLISREGLIHHSRGKGAHSSYPSFSNKWLPIPLPSSIVTVSTVLHWTGRQIEQALESWDF